MLVDRCQVVGLVLAVPKQWQLHDKAHDHQQRADRRDDADARPKAGLPAELPLALGHGALVQLLGAHGHAWPQSALARCSTLAGVGGGST